MKKLLFGFGFLLLMVGCSCNGEEEKDNGDVVDSKTCTNYILETLNDEGWSQTNGAIFTNDDDNYLVWNLSSNVFTYMHEDEHVQLFINNDQIFVGSDFETDHFDELKDEYDYDELSTLASRIHDDFDAKNCPLRGKEHEIFEEEYQDIYIEE